jgi:hypothetical protein
MFRFTIGDVLWLTVVVGMGAGWHANLRSERASHEAVIRAALAEQRGELREFMDREIKKLSKRLTPPRETP